MPQIQSNSFQTQIAMGAGSNSGQGGEEGYTFRKNIAPIKLEGADLGSILSNNQSVNPLGGLGQRGAFEILQGAGQWNSGPIGKIWDMLKGEGWKFAENGSSPQSQGGGEMPPGQAPMGGPQFAPQSSFPETSPGVAGFAGPGAGVQFRGDPGIEAFRAPPEVGGYVAPVRGLGGPAMGG